MKNIKKLIEQMTLEEKASLCSGKDFWYLKGVERLEIPSIMVTDGPHGLRKQAPLAARARWRNGTWSVVLSRDLDPGTDELVLVSNEPLQIACAVWNATAGDHSGKKSISIWQELILER